MFSSECYQGGLFESLSSSACAASSFCLAWLARWPIRGALFLGQPVPGGEHLHDGALRPRWAMRQACSGRPRLSHRLGLQGRCVRVFHPVSNSPLHTLNLLTLHPDSVIKKTTHPIVQGREFSAVPPLLAGFPAHSAQRPVCTGDWLRRITLRNGGPDYSPLPGVHPGGSGGNFGWLRPGRGRSLCPGLPVGFQQSTFLRHSHSIL